MAKTPEGSIQKYGQEQLKKRGCLVRKISYEGRRGCPDHFVGVPEYYWEDSDGGYGRDSKIILIEYKRDENTKPAILQLLEHDRLRAVGVDVRVIGTRQQVDDLIAELFPGE